MFWSLGFSVDCRPSLKYINRGFSCVWLALPGHADARGEEQPQGCGVAVALHRD